MIAAALADVAEVQCEGDAFDRCLANFLDSFYACPSAEALVIEPRLLSKVRGDIGQVRDAYLAGTAEELATAFGFPVPASMDGGG